MRQKDKGLNVTGEIVTYFDNPEIIEAMRENDKRLVLDVLAELTGNDQVPPHAHAILQGVRMCDVEWNWETDFSALTAD